MRYAARKREMHFAGVSEDPMVGQPEGQLGGKELDNARLFVLLEE